MAKKSPNNKVEINFCEQLKPIAYKKAEVGAFYIISDEKNNKCLIQVVEVDQYDSGLGRNKTVFYVLDVKSGKTNHINSLNLKDLFDCAYQKPIIGPIKIDIAAWE